MMKSPRTPGFLHQLWIADLISNALAWILFLYITVTRSATRLLWSDEILSAVLLRQRFGTMFWSWSHGADGGGPLFYLTGWVWERLFGASDLSLRLLSAVALCASFSVLWRVARYFYRPLPVAVGTFVVYLASEAVNWHLANARFYGLFLLAASLAMLAFVRALAPRPVSSRLLLLTFAAHLFLTGTHPLGAFYSATILLALLLTDRLHGRLRPRLYLAGAAGWLILLPSLPAMLNSSKAGKQFFWTVPPTWEMLRSMVTLYSVTVDQALFAAAILLGALWVTLRRAPPPATPGSLAAPDSRPVLVLVVCVYAGTFLVFLKSCFGLSLAADRYILPTALALALLFAELASRIFSYLPVPSLRLWPFQLLGIVPLALGMSSIALSSVPLAGIYPTKGYDRRLLSHFPSDATVLVPYDLSIFAVAIYYNPLDQRLLFPVDHTVSGPNTMGVALARLWNDSSIFPGHIPEVSTVLDGHSTVYVVLSSSGQDWWDHYVRNNPHTLPTQIGAYDEFRPVTLWRIDQR